MVSHHMNGENQENSSQKAHNGLICDCMDK